MTKAKSRHGKLKGAVLLMVLAVMTVLIILLAGTIAVVYSAHNRSMLKYEESQAYYTSRSVLDAFTESMLDNETDTLSGRTYYYVKDDGTGNPILGNTAADGDDFTLGMAIEEDIFKLPISTETDPTDPNYNEWFHSTFVKSAADGGMGLSVADATKLVNMATSDISSDAKYSALRSYYDQYVVRENWGTTSAMGKNDTITYKVGSLDSYGSGYGKMTDRGTQAYITVQVLEREYNLGTGSNIAEQFRNGNRTKDYVKCKATAHVIYDGRETTTSKIFVTGEQTKVSSSDAIVSLSDISGNDTVVSIGGASSLHNGTMLWSNNTSTAGNLFIWDGVSAQNTQPNVHIFGDEKFIALGSVEMNQYPIFHENGSIFYCQNLDLTGGAPFGSSSAKTNIITPVFTISHPNALNQVQIYGRVFAESIDFVNGYGNNGYAFYDSVYVNTLKLGTEYTFSESTSGSSTVITTKLFKFVYSGGALTVYPTKDFCKRFPGVIDVTNPSKVNIAKSIEFTNNGKHFVIDFANPSSSSFYISGSAVSITSANLQTDATMFNSGDATELLYIGALSQFTADKSKSVKIDYKNDAYWNLDADMKKVSKDPLPDNLITIDASITNKLTLPTVQSLYGNYMQADTSSTGGTYDGLTFDSNGNFNSALGGGGLDFTNPTVLTQFIKEHVKTAEMVKPEVASATITGSIGTRDAALEATYPTSEQIPSSYTKVISGDCQLVSGANVGQKIAIDARSSSINIQLGNGTGGQFFGEFTVYGDNQVNFLMPATGTGLNYDLGSSGYDFLVFDNDTEKSYTGNGSKYSVGPRANNPTPPPNINFYAAKGVDTITLWRGGYLQGYFYAPFSTVAMGGGANGQNKTVFYNNTSLGSQAITVCGSIFCYKYGGNQKPGVVYIDPNADDIDQSKPKLYWDRSKWISSYN